MISISSEQLFVIGYQTGGLDEGFLGMLINFLATYSVLRTSQGYFSALVLVDLLILLTVPSDLQLAFSFFFFLLIIFCKY